VLTAAEAAAWDAQAREHAQIPSRVLMEAAGRAAAGIIAQTFADQLARSVIVAAGPGNNGGDGWVIARALHAAGVRVSVADVSTARSPDCEANRTLALQQGVALLDPAAPWPPAGVLVDALLGTGANGAPRAPLADLVDRLCAHGAPVAAVDGPTGLDLTSGEHHSRLTAALTVTFGGFRRGHLAARHAAGRVVVVDIGFPPPGAECPGFVTDRWAGSVVPSIGASMHKGERGRLLVIGGGRGMAGAAMHVARAAFAAGAGLVKLALDAESVRAAQTNFPDALTLTTALAGNPEPALIEAMSWADAIVLGPGLGRGPEREAFARAVVTRCAGPIVIDADALHVPDVAGLGEAPRVLTPHAGEFAAQFPALADLARTDRYAAAMAAVVQVSGRAAVLLKGVPTVIAERQRTRVVAAGNPALATGGSGDLLAGCIGAWLARGLAPGDAAALGAQALGRAAERASAPLGVRATRPEDVAAAFSGVWQAWNDQRPPAPPILVALDAPAVA